MRRPPGQLVQGGRVELMEKARGRLAGLDGVHDDHRAVAGDEVKQGQAHLGGFADVNGGVSGQLRLEFAHDEQADGIVREDVIAEAEEEELARGGRQLGGMTVVVHKTRKS